MNRTAKTPRAPRVLGALGVLAVKKSIPPEGPAQLRQFLAALPQRSHAEILRLQQPVPRALDEVAERIHAEPVHALAGAHRQVEIRHRLADDGLLLLAQRLGGPETQV